jgi:hypothetical protein
MTMRFIKTFRALKASLVDEKSKHYVLHTSVGPITISQIADRKDIGYVFINGLDAEDNPVFVGFSDEQIATFALEVRINKGAKGSIGFKSGIEHPKQS